MVDDKELVPSEETLFEAFQSQLKSAPFWSSICGIVGFIATVAGGILFLSIEDIQSFSLSVLIIGLLLLFIALILSPRGIAMFLVGRQARIGTNILIMTLAFFIIIALLNFLFFYNLPT